MSRFHRSGFGRRALQFYFVLGLLGLAGIWFFYSQFLLLHISKTWKKYTTTLATKLEEETQLRTRIYAKFMSRITEPGEISSPELDIIFDEVIQKIDFPVVITDPRGNPVTYRNLTDTFLSDTQKVNWLFEKIRELDIEHEPIPVVVQEGDSLRLLSVIHYGVSPSTITLRKITTSLTKSVRQLRLFSFIQLLLFFGFITVGVWGILAYKRREQEHIWTALAKETAHQLATPISSITAWLEMLKDEGKDELVREMEEDLSRMKEVLNRFSRIGLPPNLEVHNLSALITHSVEFVRRRTPKTVELKLLVNDDPPVKVDGVLFSWALENLIKNGVDAIGAKVGTVQVRQALTADGRFLEIEVTDTGEGVKINRLFEPGVTTKRYGWGVGLTLAKRIIEDYHQGKLVLKESSPGRTVFGIYLPVVKGD
ncbi:MAG: HAMP domain-containing sensor histidine kinase [candidate division WOR-3 bacterium]